MIAEQYYSQPHSPLKPPKQPMFMNRKAKNSVLSQ